MLSTRVAQEDLSPKLKEDLEGITKRAVDDRTEDLQKLILETETAVQERDEEIMKLKEKHKKVTYRLRDVQMRSRDFDLAFNLNVNPQRIPR